MEFASCDVRTGCDIASCLRCEHSKRGSGTFGQGACGIFERTDELDKGSKGRLFPLLANSADPSRWVPMPRGCKVACPIGAVPLFQMACQSQ